MRKLFYLITLAAALAACKAAPAPEATPTLSGFHIGASPVISPSDQTLLQECARETPDSVLFWEVVYDSNPDPAAQDITLWWGDPHQNPALSSENVFVVELTQIHLELLVNEENPLQTLDAETARQIFTGEIASWSDLSLTGQEGSIQTWIYPSEHPLQLVFSASITNMQDPTVFSQIAPGTLEMLDAVREDPGAIGFIPAGFEAPGVRLIALQPQPDAIRYPLLAITTEPRSPRINQLLICFEDVYQ